MVLGTARDIRLPRQPVGNEKCLFQELEKLGVFKTLLAACEGTSRGQVPQNTIVRFRRVWQLWLPSTQIHNRGARPPRK